MAHLVGQYPREYTGKERIDVKVIPDYSALRLKDRLVPNLRVLFVGINPGVRSAVTGHHFAGFSNRFWKLLWESALVPVPITFEEDDRLPEWGFGITNLVARPTPGINDLRPAEYLEGWTLLERKIRRYRPANVALVGVTLFRVIRPLLADVPKTAPIDLGLQPESIHGARIFVLPNPSGRNANFSYAEMLAAFRALKRATPAVSDDLSQPKAAGATTRRRTAPPTRRLPPR